MKVIVYGASGMVGKGVLLECVDAADVESILVVGRTACGTTDAKIREVLQKDLLDTSAIRDDIAAAGLSEAEYRAITYDLSVGVARALHAIHPQMTFVFVSGAGTGGKSMWARVKKEAEDAVLALGFARAYMFRPAFIQPQRGIRSKTGMYRAFYAVMSPFYPLWRALFPKYVTTTAVVGQAMLKVARDGHDGAILENGEINRVAAP